MIDRFVRAGLAALLLILAVQLGANGLALRDPIVLIFAALFVAGAATLYAMRASR